jgi:hypothetical protein
VQTSPEPFTCCAVPAGGGGTQQSGVVAEQRELASATRAVPAAHFPVTPSFEHAPPRSAHVTSWLEITPPLLLAPVPEVEEEHPAANTNASTRPYR